MRSQRSPAPGSASSPSPRRSRSTSERSLHMPDVTITPSEDGPYIVSGRVTLVAPDGHELEHPDTMSMCRCGQSSNKPGSRDSGWDQWLLLSSRGERETFATS